MFQEVERPQIPLFKLGEARNYLTMMYVRVFWVLFEPPTYTYLRKAIFQYTTRGKMPFSEPPTTSMFLRNK